MKIQDIAFIVLLIGLIVSRKMRLLVGFGIVFVLLSMPLFHMKTALFTAERLTIYAAGLFLISTIMLIKSTKVDHYNNK